MSNTNPSTKQIVAQLRNGDRDYVDDADNVEAIDDLTIETTHEGKDGKVVVEFTYFDSYEVSDDGSDRFNLISGGEQ